MTKKRSKIEIAPKEYRIKSTYNEAVLYCFQLNIDGKIGWRLPTWFEYRSDVRIDALGYECWYRGDTYTDRFWCIPVRDII
jgi:hypothetical protein